jgi:hypothetical protein
MRDRISFALIVLLAGACAVEPETATQSRALLPESEGSPEITKAILADGSVVSSRPGDEPGETELWLEPASPNDEPRVLFPAPGADDRPTVLLDSRLLFVSTRTTIASLWIADLQTNQLTQLTNRGLSAGKPRDHTFTPPPHGPITVHKDSISYDAGGGLIVRLSTGGAR